MAFDLVSEFGTKGDQEQAIGKLVKSVEAGNLHQTLLGVTGSGKTFTMANVIEQIGRPALIMSHNKTLAAQLYSEFKNFFPHNAVEYFVSYFDYYQPEAYIPADRHLHREGFLHQRRDRTPPPEHDGIAPHPAGHDRGGLRELHLRSGLARTTTRA